MVRIFRKEKSDMATILRTVFNKEISKPSPTKLEI